MAMATQIKYKKTVSADDSGFQYERKIATLVALRLYNSADEFFLGNNFSKAGKFDDLVFKFRQGNNWNSCFVQLKHKQEFTLAYRRITRSALRCGAKGNTDFQLLDYLQSFIDVTGKFYGKDRDVMFSSNFNSANFVIFTNAYLDDDILQNRQDLVNMNFLSTNPQNEINIRFDPEKDADLFSAYSTTSKEWCKEFIKKLIFCSGQASVNSIDALIEEEVKKTSDLSTTEIKYVVGQLKDYFNNWYNSEQFLTKPDIQMILSKSLVESKAGKPEDVYIKYTNSFLKTYSEYLQPGLPHVLTCKADNTAFCIAALKQLGLLTEPNKFISLKNLERPEIQSHLLNSYGHGALVVECETDHLGVDIEKLIIFIKELNKRKPQNLIILVLTYINSKVSAAVSALNPKRRGFNCTLKNLDEESRKLLMDCSLSFQGCQTSLGSLLSGTKAMDDVFDIASMTNLVLGRELNIGIKPVEQISYYVTRILTRFFINSSIFVSSPANMKLVLTGITLEKAKSVLFLKSNLIVAASEVLLNRMSDAKVIVIEDSSPGLIFQRLAEIMANLHWLAITSKNKLSWKASTSDIRNLVRFLDRRSIEYVPTDNIMKIEEKMVIISAEPGMGKSTLLVHLAAETKCLCPELWVVTLCLNDYAVYLANSQFMVNIEANVKNVVALAAGASEETSKFDARLFNHCYDSGNMVVLLDGFDEITPYYTKQGIAVMHVLRQTKIARVWITTRPLMRNLLQNEFSVLSYAIRPFCESDQTNFLKKYWKGQIPDINNEILGKFIEILMKLIKSSFDAQWNIFTGIALQTRMIAEVFNSELRFFHETGKLDLPNAINGLQLFQTFVQRKLDIMIEEKLKIGSSSAASQSLQKNLMETHELFLMKLALLAILPAAKCSEISPPMTQSDVAELKQMVNSEGDRTGIVISYKADTPQFIHRTFAEYFVAKFFAFNVMENRDFLMSTDFASDAFNFVRYFFDRMLAGDSSIHRAVLDRDVEALKAGINTDLNLKDQGGRTALHIAAGLSVSGEIIRILLHAGANKYVRDGITEWLPVEYAIKSQCLENIAPLMDGPCSYSLIKDIMPVSCESLKVALAGDYLLLFRYLLENGMTSYLSNVLPEYAWKEGISCDGLTLLHVAAAFNSEIILNDLLESSAQWFIERKDAAGNTPLLLAVSSGSLEAAKLLLATGAQLPDHKPGENDLAQIAVESSNSEIFHLLLTTARERKVPPGWFTGALSSLIANKTPTAVSSFLSVITEFPQLVDSTTNKHVPLLIAACMKKNVDIVEILCSHEVNVNVKYCGKTALHFAVQAGQESLIKALLKQPFIDIDAKDSSGYTALYTAAANGCWSVFEVLINHGSDINCTSNDGSNLSHAVATSCELSIFQYLIAKGIDFNSKNYADVSAVELLKAKGMDDLIKLLQGCSKPFKIQREPQQIGSTFMPDVESKIGSNNLAELKEKLGENSDLYKNLIASFSKLETKNLPPRKTHNAKMNRRKKKSENNLVVPTPSAFISTPSTRKNVTQSYGAKSQNYSIPPPLMQMPSNSLFSSYQPKYQNAHVKNLNENSSFRNERKFALNQEQPRFPSHSGNVSSHISLPDMSVPPPNASTRSRSSGGGRRQNNYRQNNDFVVVESYNPQGNSKNYRERNINRRGGQNTPRQRREPSKDPPDVLYRQQQQQRRKKIYRKEEPDLCLVS